MKKILLAISLFATITLSAQIKLDETQQLTNCSQKTAKYTKSFINQDCQYFSNLRPSVKDDFNRQKYCRHDGSYIINAKIDDVWNACMTTNPIYLWHGKKILSLTFIYDNKNEKLLKDFQNYKLDSSQIYFINLKIMCGIYNLPTALMVTKIDSEQKLIIFTYLKNGKSEGRQELQFVADGEKTKIIHTTHFASGKKFRDKKLYPYFHQKTITELHKNIDSFSQKK